MPIFITIPVSELFLDTANPRLEEGERSQLETIRDIAIIQKQKLINLAENIVQNHLNPSEALIVMQKEESDSQYLVLEGNRRLAAIKILENPDIVSDIYSSRVFKDLKNYSQLYQANPISFIQCVVVNERDEASNWIEQRHTGEQDGVGIVGWGGIESARFRSRYGKPEIAIQILDFLEREDFLSRDERRGLSVTNLKRVVEGLEAREKIGYEIKEGVFIPGDDHPRVAKLLKRVVLDFSSGKKKVKDIYLKADRIRYIDEIIAEETKPDSTTTDDNQQQEKADGSTGSSTTAQQEASAASSDAERESGRGENSGDASGDAQSGDSTDDSAGTSANTADGSSQTGTTSSSGTSAGGGTQQTQASGSKNDKTRKFLVPRGLTLTIRQDRVREIFQELKRLPLSDYPNAVAVLFRVFLELSVDDYIYRHRSDFPKDPSDTTYKLSAKMTNTADHLLAARKLNEQQARALRHAANLDHNKISMVDLLNQLVHNIYMKPSAEDLRVRWDNLEDLFTKIWA